MGSRGTQFGLSEIPRRLASVALRLVMAILALGSARHSQGQPLQNPIAGKYFDWPVGFLPGQRLADHWKLEELKLGTTNFYQYADLTAHKNRTQGNDFVQSNMYHRQLRCFDCHDVHSNQNAASLRLSCCALTRARACPRRLFSTMAVWLTR
jgi:hypothetical protein